MKNFEDYKLTPRQEKFVRLANEWGFTNKITRKQITLLQAIMVLRNLLGL